ncbi:tetraspanin-32 isoform X3 [Marmota marmota marmota]|uniref:tetraspanin-32 isoform X3 n=1 Tax=Marmota marmota marmota TaxID=9994 RepID=UPI002093C5F2|nr:tetraspanin-32 isoform X3 [Marmota marmota marmota]
MHLRPGRAAVVQGPAWQETTQRSRGEERRGATAMGPGRRVGVAKCQMLVTCFLVLVTGRLLSISMATAMALLHFEDRFAVVSRASVDSNPLEAVHRWVFSMGISLAGLLSLGATLSAAATMREAPGLLAMDHKTEPLTSVSGAASLHTSCQPTQATRLHTVTRPLCSQGFLCFALVFCSLVQVAFWRFHNPTQVEDTMLDTYDLVYDQAVRSPSSIQGPELAAIQDTFLCCGKRSPFQLLGSREADPCRGEEAAREDCLQSIRSFLKTPQNIAFMLTSTGLALMVYAMLLSSFLYFAVRSGRGLDRRGKYTLTPRACGCQAQEPSRFTLSQGGPVPRRSSEAEALAGHRGPRGCLHDPHLLQS